MSMNITLGSKLNFRVAFSTSPMKARCPRDGKAESRAASSGALDRHHALHLLKRPHHVLQLREIGAGEGEDVDGASVVTGAAVRLADVDALRAESMPNVGEDARAIGGHHSELHGAVDLGLGVPGDLDATLGIGIERFGASAAVNGDPAATRDESQDVVARQRIAAARVTNQHVIDAVQPNSALVALDHLAHEARDASF